MSDSQDASPGEDCFNDLSQPLLTANGRHSADSVTTNGQIPKPKRIACVLCRKRKLKCDGGKPACGTCARLQHDCSYDEVRRKSGPKRGYVKALEARLAQVETMLKTQDEHTATKNDVANTGSATVGGRGAAGGMGMDSVMNMANGASNVDIMPQQNFTAQAPHPQSLLGTVGGAAGAAPGQMSPEDSFPWEMIGLGLDEPLPSQEAINELNQVYFEKIHPSLPMIHRPRFHAAMNLAPHMRPPVCLRYAMWCNAAAATEKYESLQEHFYLRARKYAQQDEMKGHGESTITVAHCQAWVLLTTYEFKLMYFPRAWMSAGRACRLAQMMGLHRLDGNGLDVKQCLPPPRDWTEREERRRSFWMSFCVDRYSSIGTGWPMTIDERDIMSSLPSSEEAFELSRPETTMELADALKPDGPSKLSNFSSVVLMACLFGRNLTHLHRSGPDDNDDDLNGEFWKRHRDMDNVLLNNCLALPANLRLPAGMNNANIVFMNMSIHTSTICLHQAAIFKADKNRMPARISTESKVRCITAAAEIASIMRQVSHVDLSGMNPFISFCLYVAARVFVQYLKSRPNDAQVRASLQFLLQAMHAIKRVNPLTESFLVQLDVDLESAGLDENSTLRAQMSNRRVTTPGQPHKCPVTGFESGSDITTHNDSMDPGVSYSDPGLALYGQPDQSGRTPSDTNDQFRLPTRQRTPGSAPGSGVYRSPNPYNLEMDTSPDGSGMEHQTPGSNSQLHSSTHTSASTYSPRQDIRNGNPTQNTNRMPAVFNPNDTNFPPDFGVANFTTSHIDGQQSEYVLPQTWAGVPDLNPVAGATPGSMGPNPAELMGMSDADWTQVLETFNHGWESGLGDDHTQHQQVTFDRRI